ncbi:hypothetical protein AGIG_G14490 [Arapaima gigas]
MSPKKWSLGCGHTCCTAAVTRTLEEACCSERSTSNPITQWSFRLWVHSRCTSPTRTKDRQETAAIFDHRNCDKRGAENKDSALQVEEKRGKRSVRNQRRPSVSSTVFLFPAVDQAAGVDLLCAYSTHTSTATRNHGASLIPESAALQDSDHPCDLTAFRKATGGGAPIATGR